MKKIAPFVVGLAAALVAFAVVGAVLGKEEGAKERVEEYLSGNEAREFVSAEGQFRATFPGAPDRSTESLDIDGRSIPIVTFSKDVRDAGFGVSTFALEPGAAYSLDGAVNGTAAAVEGRVESATPISMQGFEAVEFVLSIPDGRFLKAATIRAPGRVYQLSVLGDTNPPGDYDKFKGSFEILP